MARSKRQRPKKAWKKKPGKRWSTRDTPPLRHPREETTTTTTYMNTPGVQEYPRHEDQHAVTTNQEPPYSWPPVDLPPLTGFTVNPAPEDYGQANPSTIYTSAALEQNPAYDYNTGNSSGGSGDIYPGTNGQGDPDYPPDATDVQGDQYA